MGRGCRRATGRRGDCRAAANRRRRRRPSGRLQDVIQDTSTTAADLLHAVYASGIVAMVELLTKAKVRVPHDERIAKIIVSGNLGAILIKLSDNEDNASPNRLLPEGGEKRALRYAASMARLRMAAEAMGYPPRVRSLPEVPLDCGLSLDIYG